MRRVSFEQKLEANRCYKLASRAYRNFLWLRAYSISDRDAGVHFQLPGRNRRRCNRVRHHRHASGELGSWGHGYASLVNLEHYDKTHMQSVSYDLGFTSSFVYV